MGTNDGNGGAGVLDLAAWRAEAGACAPLDAAATKAPWRSTWGDDEGADAERGKRGEEVTIEAVGLEGLARIVLGVTWYDGPHPCCREEDAAFIEAARDGWPRDAARVVTLADRCAALEEALAEALDGWEGTVSDVGVTSYHTIQRLRALVMGRAGEGESR